MTDEEKAEEYANEIEYCDKVYNEISGGYTILYDKDQLIEAVMYGLAEGKPKWHDLRKDPNDLPEQITLVIMYIIGNAYCNGWFNGDGWIIDNGNMKKIDCENVIAWCELPKFEE